MELPASAARFLETFWALIIRNGLGADMKLSVHGANLPKIGTRRVAPITNVRSGFRSCRLRIAHRVVPCGLNSPRPIGS